MPNVDVSRAWPARFRLLRPLSHSAFALLWFGQTVSRSGDAAYAAVLTWTVYAISGSTAETGYVLAAFSIPQLILLLAGGIVGDRFPRRSVILVSDIASGAAIGSIALLALVGRLNVLELALLSQTSPELGLRIVAISVAKRVGSQHHLFSRAKHACSPAPTSRVHR